MSQAKNSTQVLKAAKWILENVGWVQNHFFQMDEQGRYTGVCLSEALVMVEKRDIGLLGKAVDRLIKVLPNRYDSIVAFNDNHETTKEMVINLINKALKKGSK